MISSMQGGYKKVSHTRWCEQGLVRNNQNQPLRVPTGKEWPGHKSWFLDCQHQLITCLLLLCIPSLVASREQIMNYLDENPNSKLLLFPLGKDINNKCSL